MSEPFWINVYNLVEEGKEVSDCGFDHDSREDAEIRRLDHCTLACRVKVRMKPGFSRDLWLRGEYNA